MIERALILAGAGGPRHTDRGVRRRENHARHGPPARPVASAICSPVSYGGPGRPRFLIVNNYSYQGPHRGHGVQAAQAIKMVLADRGWRAGPFTIGLQACEETSARDGSAQRREVPAQRAGVRPGSQRARRHRAVDLILRREHAGDAESSPGRSARRYQRLQHLRRPHPRRRGTAPGEPQRYFPTGQRSYARLAPSDDVQGAADALVAQHLGLRRAYVLDDRSPYGTALAGAFGSAAGRLGVDVVGSTQLSPAAHNYGRSPDGSAPPTPPSCSSAATWHGRPAAHRQLTAVLGPRVRLIAGDAFTPAPLVEAAGSRVDGMILSIAVLPTTNLPPNGRRFAAEFQKRYSQRPCCYSVHDAQATELLLDAIAKAGGNRARVAQYIIGAHVHNSLLGDFRIDRNGDTTQNTIGIYQIRAGRVHFQQAITPPSELLNRP